MISRLVDRVSAVVGIHQEGSEDWDDAAAVTSERVVRDEPAPLREVVAGHDALTLGSVSGRAEPGGHPPPPRCRRTTPP
jgi:hypothetical protein